MGRPVYPLPDGSWVDLPRNTIERSPVPGVQHRSSAGTAHDVHIESHQIRIRSTVVTVETCNITVFVNDVIVVVIDFPSSMKIKVSLSLFTLILMLVSN